MVAGHLQEKNGNYYMVLNYHGAAGKRKTKWFPTGLPVKGNKKKAEKQMDFYQTPGKGKQEKGRKAVDGGAEDICTGRKTS